MAVNESSGGPSNQTASTSQVPNSSAVPSINLPKGGGAIRGIGEKFAANPVTGTGSLSVPIATSPGRSGFGPQLSLSYDSGSGNGPFGLGWNLSLPSITRKTDKGLPRYWDGQESDEFILSGAEDLVPTLFKNDQGNWVREEVDPRTVHGESYDIQRYRPRIEGLFARIERWSHQTDVEDVFWRSISKDNITTWYGRTNNSRITDPEKLSHIYSWLICESHDDKGNVIVYSYKKENEQDLDLTQIHECNRSEESRSANRYLKHIRYGNHNPYFPELLENQPWPTPPGAIEANASDHWLFEAVLDYGEHDTDAPTPNDSGDWTCRNDPYSSYRAGFEVRTYRLCQRALMFHHFPDEAGVGADCLVRSTDFIYSYENEPRNLNNAIFSKIESVIQAGYTRQNDGSYFKKTLPPLEFQYSKANIKKELKAIDSESLENLPQGLDGSLYQWADIDGEGSGGILTEQGGAWYYKRNLSPLTLDKEPQQDPSVKFGPLETITPLPGFSNISSGQQQIMDLAGDGQVDVVSYEEPAPGFFERTTDGDWQPFKSFKSLPNIEWKDPNLKFVDLTGDGHADIFITEDQAFTWYASLAEEGFAPAQKTQQLLDEEQGPRLVFADGTQSIYLSDMSGDGLTDLVRIRNGEVCYWPNLGYCRFGAKVTMDNAPHFDTPDQFDQKRIRLADIDGSGVTDILYLKHDAVHIYLNESGNRWADKKVLTHLPAIDNTSTVMAVDLMGNGTACLVWSSPLPGNTTSPIRYVDLMGGQKPHLLTKVVNNLGAETQIHYAPSTKFYLQDKQAGKEWITRLHFPVHVVERVETYDHISHNHFATRYAYHHGYFDGADREFRGFGMVEQWDTEEYANLSKTGELPAGDNIDPTSHMPPVHTKTWFHTGMYLGRNHVSDFFAGLLNDWDIGEYFPQTRSGDAAADAEAKALLLEDTILPNNWDMEEEREACRALKGQMLRQEVYADDGSDKQDVPYTVTEQNFTIKRMQPKGDNHHAVFFTHAREVLNYHYERNSDDPRISHAITLQVDDYGNVLKSVAIGYGRRKGMSQLEPKDREKQEQILIAYTESEVTNPINKKRDDPDYDPNLHPDHYRAPLPCDVRTYELTDYPFSENNNRYEIIDFVEDDPNNPGSFRHIFDEELSYEQLATTGKQRRVIEYVRTLYRENDLTRLLPLGDLESLALPGESFKLAYTPGLVSNVYQRNGIALVPHADLDTILGGQGPDQGGYVSSQWLRSQVLFPQDSSDKRWTINDNDNHWWISSGRSYFNDVPTSATNEKTEAEQNFYLPRRFRDPFGYDSVITYDSATVSSTTRYNLLVTETTDPLSNTVTAKNNYRVLQPQLVTDPNGNRSAAAFDALGMVVGTAVMGKESEDLGDTLEGFQADLTKLQVQNFYDAQDPHTHTNSLLQGASNRIIYDLHQFYDSHQANLATPEKWKAPFSATISRETHFFDLPASGEYKTQISFNYSDGFGREIQKKIQAEPGPVAGLGININPRWVGSGWTIFNNKGKPVRQYEPFFSQLNQKRHQFEFGVQVGVSPVLFYDPVGRMIATLYPNHSFEKVIFDPWQQESWDVNDTVKLDPRTDVDIRSYVKTYFASQPADWKTWMQQRVLDPDNPPADTHGQNPEQDAAVRTLAHADTSTIAHFDSLGRPFLSIANNGKDNVGQDILFETRTILDIEGNQCEVIDAKGRIVMRYSYYMVGPEESEDGSTPNRIHQLSMEAGERWVLNDVTGNPIRNWDSRGHTFQAVYDQLRRPIENYVTGEDTNLPDQRLRNKTVLFEKSEYGESLPVNDAIKQNLRTRIFKQYDGAGVITNSVLNPNTNENETYDFKGNLLNNSRQLCQYYDDINDQYNNDIPNWSQNPTLEQEIFTTATTFDALNRPIELIAPHSNAAGSKANTIRPTYNEANLLNAIGANLREEMGGDGKLKWTSIITNIDYDAKGQREKIEYGNGAKTKYKYDPQTFRLAHLYTRRRATFTDDCGNEPPPPRFVAPAEPPVGQSCGLQNLYYCYDPSGNITHIKDDAQQTIYFKGQRVEPSNDYTYDAIYRLIEATGREHLGQAGGTPIPHSYNDAQRVGRLQPNDDNAMGHYCEKYIYDAVGNFMEMGHHRACPDTPSWKRSYTYDETSLIEDGTNGALVKKSNRLSSTTVGNGGVFTEQYGHDTHGNMMRMPQLQIMQWDYKDQLSMSQRQKVNDEDADGIDCDGERTWYIYDATGQRVRKITHLQNGNRENERLYLGGFEIYRKYNGTHQTKTLERESLHIMNDQQRVALVETKILDTTNIIEERNNDVVNQAVIRYQINNHLGSACVELDEAANVVSYEEYFPYGSTSYLAKNKNIKTAAKRYRYSGKERDEESGLSYYGARYYAAWLGRWAAVDPAGFVDGTCLYAYVSNNPIMFYDPDGQDKKYTWKAIDWESLRKEFGIPPAPKFKPRTTKEETYIESEARRVRESMTHQRRIKYAVLDRLRAKPDWLSDPDQIEAVVKRFKKGPLKTRMDEFKRTRNPDAQVVTDEEKFQVSDFRRILNLLDKQWNELLSSVGLDLKKDSDKKGEEPKTVVLTKSVNLAIKLLQQLHEVSEMKPEDAYYSITRNQSQGGAYSFNRYPGELETEHGKQNDFFRFFYKYPEEFVPFLGEKGVHSKDHLDRLLGRESRSSYITRIIQMIP